MSQSFLEYWLDLGLYQGKYKIRSKYLIVAKNMDMIFKEQWKDMWKGQKSKTERASNGQEWNNLSNKINNICF